MADGLPDILQREVIRLMREEMAAQNAAVEALVASGVPLSHITLCTTQASSAWWLKVERPRLESGSWQAFGCTEADADMAVYIEGWTWVQSAGDPLRVPVCTALDALGREPA